MTAPIRIVVADDHPIVRGGLVALLSAADDIEVVGEASDGEMAVRLALESLPDLVLMDLRMPGIDGDVATARILSAQPGIRVVVLTTYESDDSIPRGDRWREGNFPTGDRADSRQNLLLRRRLE